MAVVQKIVKSTDSELHRAMKYYAVLAALNDLKLGPKELELVAFTAVKGTITYHKDEFVKKFNSSVASLENIKGRLVRKGWLVKVDNKYKVNPIIALDFSDDLLVQIQLSKKPDGNT